MKTLANVLLYASAIVLLLVLIVCLAWIVWAVNNAWSWGVTPDAIVQAFAAAGAVLAAAMISHFLAARVQEEALKREENQRQRLGRHAIDAEVIPYFLALDGVVDVAESAADIADLLESSNLDSNARQLTAKADELEALSHSAAREGILHLRLPAAAAAIYDPSDTRPLIIAKAKISDTPDNQQQVLQSLRAIALETKSRPLLDMEAAAAAGLSRKAHKRYLDAAESLAEFLSNIGFQSEHFVERIEDLRARLPEK